MRHLNTWFALILIASALLLSAARNDVPEPEPKTGRTTESPRPQIGKKTNHSDRADGSTAPTPAILINRPTPSKNETLGDTDASAQREANYTGLLVIVGLAAIAIASFQYWAARASVNASIAAASAHVYMEIWINDREKHFDIMGESKLGDPVINSVFHNYGQSPAFLVDICWETTYGLKLPDVPRYVHVSTFEATDVVPAESKTGPMGVKWHEIFGHYLVEQNVAFVRRSELRLYLYGYFRYQDAFERVHQIGFAYHVGEKGRVYYVRRDLAPAYWYRRVTKPRKLSRWLSHTFI